MCHDIAQSPSIAIFELYSHWLGSLVLTYHHDTLHRMCKRVQSHICATAATHGQPRRLPGCCIYLPNPDYCLCTGAGASCWCDAMSQCYRVTATALPHHPRLPAAASSCAIRSRSPDDVLSSMSPVSIT